MQELGQIAERVHLATGFDVEALRVRRRDTLRVAARQLFCRYACLEGYSQVRTGAYVGIDHSTVSHAVRRIESMKDTDMIIRNYIKNYENMSSKKQVIDVAPPGYDWGRESNVLTGFECPRCSGRGSVMEHGAKESYKIDCPRCGGSGRLRAKVTIEWEADLT